MQGVKTGLRPLAEVFDDVLDKTSKTGCWLWTRAKAYGYGVLYARGERKQAHRYAYERVHGPIPNGLFVCHRCDEPACCNPDHLFLGTQADNLADMYRKLRGNTGERNGSAKLTSDQVRDMRRRFDSGGVTQRTLAREYGLPFQTIHKIVRRKKWIWAC